MVLAAFALGGAPTLPVLVVAAVPVVLRGTEGFFRLVERPSHALLRRARGYALRSRPA